MRPAPRAPRHHRLEEQAGQRGQADDVELQHRTLAFDVALYEGAVIAAAGVVDQHVDRDAGLLDLVEQVERAVAGRQIDRVGGDLYAGCLTQLAGGLLERLGAAGHQHQVVAAAGELLCHGQPDATRRAGDQRGGASCVTLDDATTSSVPVHDATASAAPKAIRCSRMNASSVCGA